MRSWPDKGVAVVYRNDHGCDIYWPRSGRRYTLNGVLKDTRMRAQNGVWVKIRHTQSKFVVTDPKSKTGKWVESDKPSEYFVIYDGQIYTLSGDAIELLHFPIDFSISANWLCVSSRSDDGSVATNLYRLGGRSLKPYREFRDTFGWIVDDAVVLVSSSGSVSRVKLGDGVSQSIGHINGKLNPRCCSANGQILVNDNTVYRCDGNSIKLINAFRTRYDDLHGSENTVALFDGYVVYKSLRPFTWLGSFDVYRVDAPERVAGIAKGTFPLVVSTESAEMLINIDSHGFGKTRHIP